MKKCSRCHLPKPLDEFNKSSKSKDGVGGWCKRCHSEYDHERYQTIDKDRKRRNYKLQMERKRMKMLQYLVEHPCIECGEDDPIVLEFNHREREGKLHDIARMMGSHAWPAILAEIEKCDVLCANCHRKVTAEQLGWWKILGSS